MASRIIQFSLNDRMYDLLLAEQSRRKKTTVSADVFAKELLFEILDPEGKKDKE